MKRFMPTSLPKSIDETQALLASGEYVADRSLATSLFLALAMKRPLFLEGEAGVGKTEIGKVMSQALGRELIRLQCYEGLDIAQAAYEWNYPRQMIEIRMAEAEGVKSREGLEQDMLSNPGPVLTTVEYLVRSEDRDAFLQAIYLLAEQRRRDGAYGWDVFEDAAQIGRFVEIFYSASWLEHLRQHERVTQADKLTQERVNAFHQGDAPPRVTHLLAAEAESGGM